MMNDALQNKHIVATVRIRRNIGKGVKSEAEQIDGKTYTFRFLWKMKSNDPYPGEYACQAIDADYPPGAPLWIASGDLLFHDSSSHE